MPLHKAKGQMYDWISHCHSHLAGACPHVCSYCAIQDMERRFKSGRYRGKLRLIEKEFNVQYGSGKTIFVENCNDLFAADVPMCFINCIMEHCAIWPDNTYVFQTKNPGRYLVTEISGIKSHILGTTIETNRDMLKFSLAPSPYDRMLAMEKLQGRKFLTLEPILNFDVDILAEWIVRVAPEFLNLGADSKNHNLPEPPVEKIHALVDKLKENGIELREKHNLQRLTQNRKEKADEKTPYARSGN